MKKKLILVIFLMGVIGMAAAVSFLIYMHPKPAAEEDVVFGQRNGEDLTFRVITPKNPNGLGLVFIVCGNWESISMHDYNVRHTAFFINKGFTVFKLYHVSQPKASVPEILEDIHRGVRYVRHNAERWNIDPDRIGLYGRSSGGQLALCVATMSDDGDPTAIDLVERQSSHVQACGVFYPVCDLSALTDGQHGTPTVPEQINFGPGSKDPSKWPKIARSLSPIYHIHSDIPPIMISHGAADTDVLIEQPKLFVELAQKAKAHPVRFVFHAGKTHQYDRLTMFCDRFRFSNFFDEILNPDEDL